MSVARRPPLLAVLAALLAACIDEPTSPLPDRVSARHPALSLATSAPANASVNPYGVIVMPGVQHDPVVGGRYIAYVDDGAGQSRMHVYDLWAGTVRWASTSSTRGVEEPSISGSRVVWTDHRSGLARIWMYDLATRTEREVVPGGASEQHHPDIDGEWVVWTEPDSAGSGIHLHNVASGQDTVLRSPGMNADHAAIGGGRVVFIGGPKEPPQTWEVYSYNVAGKFLARITNTDNAEDYPDVSGDLIVWEDHRNGSDIYAYDLAAGQQYQFKIATSSADESRPRVSGKQVVWATARACSCTTTPLGQRDSLPIPRSARMPCSRR